LEHYKNIKQKSIRGQREICAPDGSEMADVPIWGGASEKIISQNDNFVLTTRFVVDSGVFIYAYGIGGSGRFVGFGGNARSGSDDPRELARHKL
jgi:hypothetical protein